MPFWKRHPKFQCNVLDNNYMSSSGHKLKEAIQNLSTPLMDLYVRESLQNSLDAGKPDAPEIRVDYVHSDFSISDLAQFYEVLGPELEKRKATLANEFVAICDSETVGLIGRDDGIVKSYEKGQNLGNLVFNIQNAQQNEGAGGLWGLGKTVFYRMSSSGLVIFYSRIKKDGGYEERLASALVEDEQKEDACLLKSPEYVGISFYGENQKAKNGGQTRTVVVKDHDFCQQLLSVFGLEPYSGEKTGTIVIVPFIDSKRICSKSSEYSQHGKTINVTWQDDFDQYLRMCILRWYYPRLSGSYDLGPKLVVTVNGEIVKPSLQEEPFFFEMTRIYKTLVELKEKEGASFFEEGIHIEKIQAGRGFTDNQTLGWLGYEEISNVQLGVYGSAPGALSYPPAVFAGLNSEDDGDISYPLIAYIRKPGMIVAYNCKNEWTANSDIPLENGRYVIGIFVLNSAGAIVVHNQKFSLEEYVRNGEKADHCEWFDHPLGDEGNNRNVIKQISSNLSSKLTSAFEPKKDEPVALNNNFIWQKKLSAWLPTGLGKRSGPVIIGGGDGGGDGGGTLIRNVRVKMLDGATFTSKGLKKIFEISSTDSFSDFSILISLDSSGSVMTAEKLESFGLKPPYAISEAFIQFEKGCDNKRLAGSVEKIDCSVRDGAILGCLNYHLLATNNGTLYGISFSSKELSLKFKVALSIDIFDLDSQLVYDSKMGEGK